MTLAYPLTLNHCQSLCALGSLGNRNRSSIASPPICLALTREVHAVFMPVWDGFKLFSYQKAHSDILFERHHKPQISQPPFNHMSWFKRLESDLLPRRAVTVKEWDVIYHPEPHTELNNQSTSICTHMCTHMHVKVPTHAYTHTHTPAPLSTLHKHLKNRSTNVLKLTHPLAQSLLYAFTQNHNFTQELSCPSHSCSVELDHMLFTNCNYITFHPGILSKRSLLNLH